MALYSELVDRLLVAGSHFAEAGTEAELHQQWLKVQAEFGAGWDRKGHKVIFLIHDLQGGISRDDAADMLGQINAADKHQPIDIILHTRGGSAPATEQIAAAIVGRGNTAAFVPIHALSGGTEIALAAQKIHMGRGAQLSSVDLQIAGWSAKELVRTAEELGDNAPPDLRLLAREAAKALKEEEKRVCAVINRRHKGFLGWRGCALARELTAGEIPHSQGISFKQAKRFHMNVRQGVPKSVYALLDLRRQQLARLRELQRTKIVQPSAA